MAPGQAVLINALSYGKATTRDLVEPRQRCQEPSDSLDATLRLQLLHLLHQQIHTL